MESLPHDLVAHILERAPVKSLLRFKAVSKQWKSTIESRFFQNRQFKRRQQSGGPPDVLLVSVRRYEDGYDSDPETDPLEIESLRTLELGSSSSVRIPTPWENEFHFVCQNSCDGLVCLYYPVRSGFVVNPTTRWHRVLPLSNYQKTVIGIGEDNLELRFYSLGFGKDKFTGTYKPVILYNSQELGLEDATTCEVFDFDTNAWRYVTPSAPYPITGLSPAYLDGSLYWLTDDIEAETKVLSLDLHTEAFQVISKTPFAGVSNGDMVIATLDNRLCVSAYMDDEFINQDVWLFNSGNKTWDKIYSIDLVASRKKLRMHVVWVLMPLALLDAENKNKKKKLLYCSRWRIKTLAIQDPETQSCDAAFTEGFFRRHQMIIGSCSPIGVIALLVFLCPCFRVQIFRKRKTSDERKQEKLKALIPLKHYTYAQVKKITKSFAEVVGRGGFGIVYKGTLCDGRMVAVKVLKESKGNNGEDFINEVASMSQTSHVNIVTLLGFCSEGSKRAIIYI